MKVIIDDRNVETGDAWITDRVMTTWHSRQPG